MIPTPPALDEAEDEAEAEVVVETDLPKSQLTLTAEARAKRLEEIVAEVTDTYGRFKKHAERALHYAIRMGRRLKEAKAIVGPGRFMGWVNEKMPFSHRTANNYMTLAANLRFASVANLTLTGAAKAVDAHLLTKTQAKIRRLEEQWRQEEEEEKAKRRANLPLSLQRLYKPKGRKRRLRSRKALAKQKLMRDEQKAAQETRSAEYEARGFPDLTAIWPHPHEDCSRMEVEWELADGLKRIAYVWLPEEAHFAAHVASYNNFKGSVALRYRSLIFSKGNSHCRVEVEFDGQDPDGVHSDGQDWDRVQGMLSELSRDALQVRRAEPIARDPAAIQILENWRAMGDFERQQNDGNT